MPPAVRNSITYSTSYSNLMPSLHPLRVQLHHHSQICCKHKQLPVQDSKPLVLSISESPSQLTWNSMYFFKCSIRCICLPNKEVPVSLITQGTVNLMESVNQRVDCFGPPSDQKPGSRDTTSIKWFYNLKLHHQPAPTQPSLHLLLLFYKP
jgi:hypothetical protein